MQKRLLIVALTCFSLNTFAQFPWSRFHIGISAGLSNYQGDLVDKLYKSSNADLGLNLEYEISSRIIIRGSLNFAKISGADSLSNNASLRMRNLSFQSKIQEASLVGEFYTFNMDDIRWSPYVFAGLGLFHFNPYTIDKHGHREDLKPMSTEGEGLPGYPNSKPYSLYQIAIPFGGGIKYGLTENVSIGVEIGIRKTFTDYLDDVSGNYPSMIQLKAARGPEAVDLSYRGGELPGGNPAFPAKGAQRGSPKSKDYFYFTSFTLSFRLKSNNTSLGGYGHHKALNCPSNPL